MPSELVFLFKVAKGSRVSAFELCFFFGVQAFLFGEGGEKTWFFHSTKKVLFQTFTLLEEVGSFEASWYLEL